MKKLILASGNAGKLREIQAILAPLGCEVLTRAALGIADAEEPHLTFIENALAKARALVFVEEIIDEQHVRRLL